MNYKHKDDALHDAPDDREINATEEELEEPKHDVVMSAMSPSYCRKCLLSGSDLIKQPCKS